MKKITVIALVFVLALSFTGCTATAENRVSVSAAVQTTATVQTTVAVQDESRKQTTSASTAKTTDKQNETGTKAESSQKETIELQYLPYLPYLEVEQSEPLMKRVSIPYTDLSELEGQRYNGNAQLLMFAEYIRDTFGIQVDNNWEVFVHFYTEDKTVGMVQFQYYIGEVGTNKSIIFNLNNGIVDMIYHSALEASADEEQIKSRVAAFKDKYEQEKYVFRDGQSFEGETTDFSYHYGTGYLVYSYNVFIKEKEGLINNDFGATCLIDENGCAVEVVSDTGKTVTA